jgi:chemotaxis protein methyltransferase WspC
MNLEPVLGLLQRRTGLESGALGMQTVLAAVHSRMKALSLSDGDAYAGRLGANSAEFAALLDEVVVPETWFFRGGEVFDYLAGYVRSAMSARPKGSVFRALSLPCSTGEEPYSLAIALIENGCAGGCAIDGVDISLRNLDEARRGVFGELSFRQMSPGLRSRTFRAVPGGWELDPGVRKAVRFLPGNILDPGLLESASYDLILCRNLFIYLGLSARQSGLANLDRLLAPGGLLGLGYAEPLDRADRRFEPTGPNEYFLYRRASPSAITLPLPPMALLPAPRLAPPIPTPRNTVEPPPESIRTIDRAKRAADRGSYEDAYALCAGLLQEAGPDPDVYALMGVIQQARHLTEEARHHLERALYLSPNHREALFHLLLLHQQRGDVERAAVLRRRLERCYAESR